MGKPQWIAVKNYERYQHYTKRNPPWIKLYRDFINDYELRQMPAETRLTYIGCLILASETANHIPFDLDYLSQRLGFIIEQNIISPLIKTGLLLAHSASVHQPSMLSQSRDREEKRREDQNIDIVHTVDKLKVRIPGEEDWKPIGETLAKLGKGNT